MAVICYKLGESIECLSAEVVAKKIVPGVATKQNGVTMRKYTCERDGRAEILKELSPKQSRIKASSNLTLGDSLKCEKFFFLLEKIALVKPAKIHFSSSHNANSVQTKDFTFAEISHPFAHIGNAIYSRSIAGKIPKKIG